MEPADIDWKKVVSHYVPDDAYEHINAPKWLDLAAPDSAAHVDDDAWFCRPDCRHPKTAEDFQRAAATPSPKAKLLRSSSGRLPFGERNDILRDANNLKRRGGIATQFSPSSSSSPTLKPKTVAAVKKSREDLENQDPNLTTPPRPARPFKGGKTAKEMIKSSAEKKVERDMDEWQQQNSQARLKSTMSARNLFSGKDILSQISEFYHELKNMAVGRAKSANAEEEVQLKEIKKVQEAVHDAAAEERELLTPKKKGGSGKKNGKMGVRIEVEKHKKGFDENSAVLKEVRAFPPTPQKIPSPSSRGFRSIKATANTRSPLNKPPKSSPQERSILQDVGQNREERKALLPSEEADCNRASIAADGQEGSSMLWFLKPCTYLVK